MNKRLDDVTLGDLRLLAAVIDEGSITAAAMRLGLTLPTASRRLRQLEERIGAPLVHRTTRRVFLTPDGELLLPLIRELVDRARRVSDHLERQDHEPRGTLRVSVAVLVAETVLGAVVAALHARHPNLRLEIAVQNERVDLMRAGVDLALRIGRTGASPDLLVQRVGTLELMLARSPGSKPVPDVAALLDGPLLLTHVDVGPLAEALGVPESRVLDAASAIVSDRVALRDAVRAGAGVGLLPTLLAAGLERVLPEVALPTGGLFALTLPALQGDRRVGAFVDAVRDALAGT